MNEKKYSHDSSKSKSLMTQNVYLEMKIFLITISNDSYLLKKKAPIGSLVMI